MADEFVRHGPVEKAAPPTLVARPDDDEVGVVLVRRRPDHLDEVAHFGDRAVVVDVARGDDLFDVFFASSISTVDR